MLGFMVALLSLSPQNPQKITSHIEYVSIDYTLCISRLEIMF